MSYYTLLLVAIFHSKSLGLTTFYIRLYRIFVMHGVCACIQYLQLYYSETKASFLLGNFRSKEGCHVCVANVMCIAISIEIMSSQNDDEARFIIDW